MKKLVLLFIFLATPVYAAKFSHIEARPNGWQFLYYNKKQPIVVFVPKCSKTITDSCGWSKKSARHVANKLAADKEKK